MCGLALEILDQVQQSYQMDLVEDQWIFIWQKITKGLHKKILTTRPLEK